MPETNEHKLMKEITIQELGRMGFPDVETEKTIENIPQRQYFSPMLYEKFRLTEDDSEIDTVRKILGDEFHSDSSKPRVDIVVKEDGKYKAFFETERSFYPKNSSEKRRKVWKLPVSKMMRNWCLLLKTIDGLLINFLE